MQSEFRKRFEDHCWAESGMGPRKTWPNAIVQAAEHLLSSTEAMFLLVGDELAFLFNQPFNVMLGEDWEKVLGAPLRSVSGPNWSDVDPLVTRAMKGEAFLAADLHYKTWMSGFTEERHYLASFTPVRDEDGAIFAAWRICHEQSEDIRAVRSLRAQRDMLFSLMADSPTFALATEGVEHRIIFANPAFETITSRKIRVGSTLRGTFPEAERQELLPIYDDVLHKGRSFHFRGREFEIETADGAGKLIKNVDILYTPIRSNDGHLGASSSKGMTIVLPWKRGSGSTNWSANFSRPIGSMRWKLSDRALPMN